MATVYRGTRSFYEEDGRIYKDETKRIEYDPDTYEDISNMVKVTEVVAEKVVPETTTESLVTVTETPIQTISANDLVCSVCGFEAKSNAGLAVHRMKHKVMN